MWARVESGDLPANEQGDMLLLDGGLVPAGVGVQRGDRCLARELLPEPRVHRADLLAAVRRCLAAAGSDMTRLASIAVSTGPGAFTGLRVALSFASGLTLARPSIRLLGIDSPRLMATAAGVDLPHWVAIPWGRFRVLLARSSAAGPVPGSAALVPLSRLPVFEPLMRQPVAAPAAALSWSWPVGSAVKLTDAGTLDALAQLAVSGQLVPLDPRSLGPSYLVPPDATLPLSPSARTIQIALQELHEPDLTDYTQLEAAVFDTPWAPGQLAAEFTATAPAERWGVRAESGELIAAALGRITLDQFEILRVAVLRQHRRRGLARLLVRHLLDRARQHGARRADLEVAADNEPAVQLYGREGFVPVGRRRAYYRGGGDALLMSLLLHRDDQPAAAT